jgi:hypothetical protein
MLLSLLEKTTKGFGIEKDKIDVPPLLWICEIIFCINVEEGLPKNMIKIVTQDAKKVIESLKYKLGKVNFAENGSTMVFIGIRPNEKTERLTNQIREFNLKNDFNIRVQTAV